MPRAPLAEPSFHFMVRGSFPILVLRTLQLRPMHGYEVIKELEDHFQGFYRPSAGAVYPALRSLLAQGLVEVGGGERRKTYRITAKGRAFLRGRRAEMKRRMQSFEEVVGEERAALFRELRSTGRLLAPNLRAITPAKARELRKVLQEMRERMMAVLAK